MPGYRVSSHRVENPDEIKSEWLELQARSDCSYFQSWGWIGPWLEQVVGDLMPCVVKVWSGEQLVGMGIFVSKDIKRHVFVRAKCLFLNEYPYDGRNMVIEYNGLLACEGYQDAVYTETIRYLLAMNTGCDEFYFGGMTNRSSLVRAAEQFVDRINVITNEESTSWQVDLSGLGPGIDGYLDGLSKNRRYQIRRSIRIYEEKGSLCLEEADNKDSALTYFDGLKKLHTDCWRDKGQQGSFGNPRWERFHRSLIKSGFPKGEIQLLRISNPDGPIGYLYNYIWRSRVYVLQTGFRMCRDKRLLPGYVTHTLAIVHNRQKGMSVYDLMHDDALYKKILCNHSEKLYWMVIQRRHLKFRLEDLTVRIVRSCRRVLRQHANTQERQ